jgi:hypothetical protein
MYAIEKTTKEKYEQALAEARLRIKAGKESRNSIAKSLGLSRTTVQNLDSPDKREYPPCHLTPAAKLVEAKRLLAIGVAPTTIGRRLHMSRERVQMMVPGYVPPAMRKHRPKAEPQVVLKPLPVRSGKCYECKRPTNSRKCVECAAKEFMERKLSLKRERLKEGN